MLIVCRDRWIVDRDFAALWSLWDLVAVSLRDVEDGHGTEEGDAVVVAVGGVRLLNGDGCKDSD